MPGPWLSATGDPEAWVSHNHQVGDYIEFVTYDTARAKQGTVLARLDSLTERGAQGQWTEATFLAVSDEHLAWWLSKGPGANDHWQFEVHFCKAAEVIPIGDLAEKKIEWVRKSPHRKYVEEEVQRMAGGLPTGKDQGADAAQGLGFKEAAGLPPADATAEEDALKGLSRLEAELGEWFGQAAPAVAKKKKKKKRDKVDYGGLVGGSDSSDDRVLHQEAGEVGRQTPATHAGDGGEGGGPLSTSPGTSRTPPVATNCVLTILGPKQLQIRLMREMKTLATALDQIAAGRAHAAADTIAQRLKALELSQADGSWNRAQFLELLEPEGPSLLERDEAVLASKEWAGELRMRKLQGGGKGPGKQPQKGDEKGGKADTKGGKDPNKKGKTGKGAKEDMELEDTPQGEEFVGMVLDGVLDFDLGDLGESDDEGLPTRKDDPSYWSNMFDGLSMKDWRQKVRNVLNRRPQVASLGKVYMEAILSLNGTFARVHSNPERGNITRENVHWVRVVVTVLNYLYCAAWAKPVCVPLPRTLSNAQIAVVNRVAEQITRLISRGGTVGPAPESVKRLKSKKFDYNGQPIDHMQDLVAEKEAIQDPTAYLLPEAELPTRHRGSRVRASDEEWYKIVRAGYDRGMFTAVRDEDIPVDKRGHLITNGAAGVLKTKVKDGRTVELQRFISILCPTNDAMRLLPGAQDTLPYIGQLTAVMAEKDSYLVLDSEDLQSAFNLFRMPPRWAGFFAFAKKVRGDALGLSRDVEVRPGLTVVPMGWTSAVTLIQAAIRFIAYDIGKDRPIPESDARTVLYLDNFDELRRKPAQHRTRHAYEKARELLDLGLGLLSMEMADEFCLRHWTGKAAFAAAFKRPMFSILQEVYCVMDWAQDGTQISPSAPVLDEILCFSVLLPLAETDLSSPLSEVISCTDASPTGGGCSIATGFKDKSLLLPLPLEDTGNCAVCQRALDMPDRRKYPCPRQCGLKLCSLRCSRGHGQGCCRKWWHAPRFGERFSGKDFPLSKAAGLKGIETQEPLDYEVPGDRWDFKTDFGEARLDEEEDDGDLMWTHWAPDRYTFSRTRGRGFWNDQHQWDHGLPALRSRRFPEGLSQLRRQDNVAVRQGNAMAKRAVNGLLQAHRRGRFASLEHPFDSYLWDIPEVKPLYGGEWFWSTFALCCHGGDREEWLTVVHNSASLHAVLHKPQCDGHQEAVVPSSHVDPENNDEYPWLFCLVFMEGVHDELSQLYTVPFGNKAETLESLMHHQLKGATRGLQDATAVDWAVTQCVKFLDSMDTGQEAQHFAWLLRHTYHTGCDVRLTDRGNDVVGSRPGPYPAFRWLWRDVLSYKWKQPQHINVLELTAFLAELRRRSRDQAQHGRRFFCIVDSLVTFYVLGKGRSSSKRLNRICRRVTAISLATGLIPISLWTISKWNFSDGASRKFEPS
ncbi:unnamed protein product [Symbiodinium sp. CCMP2592]|nr:unnamed protein product [Symbiodinium sp. CCMP2592]